MMTLQFDLKKKFVSFLCLTGLLLIGGCRSLNEVKGQSRGKLYDRNGVDAISEDAAVRMTFFSDGVSKQRFCLGPGPDVSIAANDQMALSVAGKAFSAGSSEAAMSLGGRNPTVLIVRELMYRACEMSSNLNSDSAETISIYSKLLSAVNNIGSQSAADEVRSVSPPKDPAQRIELAPASRD